MRKFLYLLISSLLIVFSCGKTNEENENIDRAAILDNLGNIIFQRYNQLKLDADSLNIYADSFQTNTNLQNLSLLRNTYIKTYLTFQSVQAFNFAKAYELDMINAFNFYPEDTTLILNTIQTNSYNLQTLSNKAKGLQALDYLLYGLRNYNEAELLNWYATTPNATQYIKSITSEIKRISDLIYNDWNTSYLSTFKERQGIDRSSSFFILTNAIVENFEKYGRTAKVTFPLGTSASNQRLDLIEARHSEISIALLKNYVQSFEELMTGKNGLGYDDYLNTIDAKFNNQPLSNILNTQFATLKNKIEALDEPYANEIENNRQKVVEVLQAFQQLVITLKVDVASSMSIEIIYQDADGD